MRFWTKIGIGASVFVLVVVVAGLASAVELTRLDDFSDGTVMGWVEGGSSPNPPINVPNGGPLGAGDAYLENTSVGGSGAGSKMIMFNNAQWTGDYNVLGPWLAIRAHMANFGTQILDMRVAVEGANGAWFASSTSMAIPADGMWYEVVFDLTESDMVLVGGSGTLDSVLDDVVEMRILSSVAPDWRGDSIQGVLGVDNIAIDDVVFKDGFESSDVSNWSSPSP